MTCKAQVTFEFETQPPVTIPWFDVEAPNAKAAVRRALTHAIAQRPQTHWTSVVVVLDRAQPAPPFRPPASH